MNTITAGGFTVEFVGPPVAEVTLILQPDGAADALATIVRGYKQVYSPVWPTNEERAGLLRDINKTKLHTPLEMLSFVWLVRNVTRAWTHQAVRTRVGAAYVQESMRFSDKRHAKVLVPPAISADPGRLESYQVSVQEAFQTYSQMLAEGVPIQDARGVLPHNVLTHIFISYTLSTLAKTASLRYCCQAQAMTADGEGEWKTVLEQMKASLPPLLQSFVCAPWEAGEVSCGFEASFDRPCRFTDKFRPAYERLKARMEPPTPPPSMNLTTRAAVLGTPTLGQIVKPSTEGQPATPATPVSVQTFPPRPALQPGTSHQLIIGKETSPMKAWVAHNQLVVRCWKSHLLGGDSLMLQDWALEKAEAMGAMGIWLYVEQDKRLRWLSLGDFYAKGRHDDMPEYPFNPNWLIAVNKFQEVPNGA